jgi:hypothetical protein
MSIVLVGGHDRMHREYEEIGKACGHRVKVFTHFDGAVREVHRHAGRYTDIHQHALS